MIIEEGESILEKHRTLSKVDIEQAGYDRFFESTELNKIKKSRGTQGVRVSHSKNAKNIRNEGIKDGDYIYAPSDMHGVYHVSDLHFCLLHCHIGSSF